MATLVKIYQERGNQLLAVFPQLKEFNGYRTANVCYSHIGQHSTSHPEYHSKLKLAPITDCNDLVSELTSIGYNLRVLNKQ